MKLYTGRGDDGTTGLYYGGRVAKDAVSVQATGAVDEAQAALGTARGLVERGSEMDAVLVGAERALWTLMAELSTAPANRHKLVAGTSLVTSEMVSDLERVVDGFAERFEMPREFVLPGQGQLSAALDVARTVVRRAERLAVQAAEPGSEVVPFLNRLSTLCWALARFCECEPLAARPEAGASGRRQ